MTIAKQTTAGMIDVYCCDHDSDDRDHDTVRQSLLLATRIPVLQIYSYDYTDAKVGTPAWASKVFYDFIENMLINVYRNQGWNEGADAYIDTCPKCVEHYKPINLLMVEPATGYWHWPNGEAFDEDDQVGLRDAYIACQMGWS